MKQKINKDYYEQAKNNLKNFLADPSIEEKDKFNTLRSMQHNATFLSKEYFPIWVKKNSGLSDVYRLELLKLMFSEDLTEDSTEDCEFSQEFDEIWLGKEAGFCQEQKDELVTVRIQRGKRFSDVHEQMILNSNNTKLKELYYQEFDSYFSIPQ